MTISKRQLEERELRKERILTGALDVFKKKGTEGATMDEIAASSGFGKATLYYYFHSKEEVFSAILVNGWESLWISLEPIIAEETRPRKTFINILLKIAENIRNRPGLYEFLFNVPKIITIKEQPWKLYQNRLYAIIQGLLEDGVKAGEFPQLDTQLLFKAMGGLFMGLFLSGDRNKPVSEQDIEELLNQLIINPQEQ